MKNLLFSFLFFGGVFAFAHDENALPRTDYLKFRDGAIQANVEWQQGPRSPHESNFRLTWLNSANQQILIPLGDFEVSLFMPSMGHGSAPVTIIPFKDATGREVLGSYFVSQVFFLMEGEWQIRITLSGKNGTKAETQSFNLLVKESSGQHQDAVETSLNSPALKAICADGVTPHPKWPGFWHIDRPNFANSPDALYATMHLRPNENGEYAVVRVNHKDPSHFREIIRFKEPIRDLAFHQNKVWILFRQKIVAINPTTGEKSHETVTSWDSLTEDQTAFAFVWRGDQLVIAHGSKGMMIYDPRAQGITQAHHLGMTSDGLVLKAIDVAAVSDNQIAFAIENVSVSNHPPFPFNGIILVDRSGSIERYPYSRRSSGSLSNARIAASGGQLLINNWGILHSVSIASMKRAGEVNVNWTPIYFDVKGKKRPGELLGDMLIDRGQLIACAQIDYQDEDTRKILHFGVVYDQVLPRR